MAGLEGLIQYGYSPFGGTDIMQTIGGAAKKYGEFQSPEAQLKRTLGDLISGKKTAGEFSPEIRKLLGIGETKEDVLLKRYLEGDKSPEVLEGLGMRVTKTPKETALEALGEGGTYPGLSVEETKKLGGVFIEPGEETSKEGALEAISRGETVPGLTEEETKKLAGVLIGEEAPRKITGADVREFWKATPIPWYERVWPGAQTAAGKERLGMREKFREQFGVTKPTVKQPGKKVKAGDTITYQGKKYKVEGFNTEGDPLIDTSKPLD